MPNSSRRTISNVVDEILLKLNGVEKTKNHDRSMKYRVGGKTFAMYMINHHGDGRTALWLKVPRQMQGLLVESDESVFFVPPYVGKQGWIGINLTMSSEWDEIIGVILEAYVYVSGSKESQFDHIDVDPPRDELVPEEMDPFNSETMQCTMSRIERFLEQLPDVNRGQQFGGPVFKVGRKSFLYLGFMNGDPCIEVWVGKEAQPIFLPDERFVIPKYTGHNGWIMCRTSFKPEDQQARELLLRSYRHFALKRTLKELESKDIDLFV